ncbi:hypothetical protein T265_12271 [Opisthorchis viverrini]|uniref:C2H2-type domain-containing protein n=1 Tax=Opisthorchis viverrini TaxID=6198 RepID=A0A074YUI1_OPIVI|nr:hypothetical protein T265_12271 [Opisthorchis viverrini]KER18446.1 hypothetical protein T265_12271 [Opisthorchis viverrini]
MSCSFSADQTGPNPPHKIPEPRTPTEQLHPVPYARGDGNAQLPFEGCTDGRSRIQCRGPMNVTASNLNVGAHSSHGIPFTPQPVLHSRVVQQHRELFQAINRANQERFQCTYCGRSYRHQTSLVGHHRTCKQRLSVDPTDSDDELLSCGACGMVFSKESHFRRHMQKHAPFGAHKCQVCGKAYRYKSSLSAHISRHHAGLSTAREAVKPTGHGDAAKDGSR